MPWHRPNGALARIELSHRLGLIRRCLCHCHGPSRPCLCHGRCRLWCPCPEPGHLGRTQQPSWGLFSPWLPLPCPLSFPLPLSLPPPIGPASPPPTFHRPIAGGARPPSSPGTAALGPPHSANRSTTGAVLGLGGLRPPVLPHLTVLAAADEQQVPNRRPPPLVSWASIAPAARRPCTRALRPSPPRLSQSWRLSCRVARAQPARCPPRRLPCQHKVLSTHQPLNLGGPVPRF